MPRERNASEQERLDRIERHINQLTDASAALQREMKIARQLAADRAHAVKSTAPAPRRKAAKPPSARRGDR